MERHQIGDHNNLVSLIGVVTSGEPLMLLLSYCHHGALLELLQRKKQLDESRGVDVDGKYNQLPERTSIDTAADGYTVRGSLSSSAEQLEMTAQYYSCSEL